MIPAPRTAAKPSPSPRWTGASHGTVTLVGGVVKYTPAPHYFGPDAFWYTLSDGHDYSTSVAVVSVNVTKVNLGPTAVNDSVVVDEDTEDTLLDVLANDTDPEGDALTIIAVGTPQHGTATTDGTTVSYTPAPDYYGLDTFTYTISDGTVTAVGAVTVQVLDVPDLSGDQYPVAVTDAFAGLLENAPNALDVLANDYDPDLDPLTITAVTQPEHGTVVFTATGVTYTPADYYFGPDSFTYTIRDPQGATATTVVTLTVDRTADDAAPTVTWDLLCVPMNGSGRTLDVMANDLDPEGDALTLTLPGETDPGYPVHGTLTLVTETGQPDKVRYVPAPNYFGLDEFTYSVSDGHGGTATGSVSVLVYKLSVGVSPGFPVPGTTPVRWAVPVGDAGQSVQLMVLSEPAGVDFSEMSVAWTGATVDPEYPPQAYLDQHQTVATSVGVTVTDADSETISTSAQVVVVGIDHIASDSSILHEVESGNAANAVTGVGSDPATVTVKAIVTPSTPDVSAVYDKLLVWISGGEAGSTPDRRAINRTAPEQTSVTVRCGASKDTLDVWAVQVKLAMGVADADKMSDDHAVPVYYNNNDDNKNGLPDLNESNTVQGLGIMGETDLTGFTLRLQPDGVPVGTVALTVPSQLAVCADDTKYGGRMSAPSWNLVEGPLPAGAYLEGTTLCAPQVLTVGYVWNSITLSADSGKVTVVAQPATGAKCSWQLYAMEPTLGGGGGGSSYGGGGYYAAGYGGARAAGITMPLSRGRAVGGDIMVVLRLDLPARGYVMADSARFSITDDAYPEITSGGIDKSFSHGFWFTYDPFTAPDEWSTYTDDYNGAISFPPSAEIDPYFTIRDHPVTICTKYLWHSRTTPSLPGWVPEIGTNGPHTVQLDSYRTVGMTTFTPATTLPITQLGTGVVDAPLRPVTVEVQNLVVDVKCTSAGPDNKDYFAYDPDPDSPAEHHRPWIKFTVADACSSSHTYEYQIFVQPTSASGFDRLEKDGAYAWLVGTCSPGTGTICVPYNGTKGLDQATKDVAEWSTYTFDVGVIERDLSGEIVDRFYFKWPYCLSLGEHTLSTTPDTMGYGLTLKYTYIYNDYAHSRLYGISQEPTDMHIIVVDPDLEERNRISLDLTPLIDVEHSGDAFYNAHCYDQFDYWRTVYVGQDNCWVIYKRNHSSNRMLAQNLEKVRIVCPYQIRNEPIEFLYSTEFIIPNINIFHCIDFSEEVCKIVGLSFKDTEKQKDAVLAVNIFMENIIKALYENQCLSENTLIAAIATCAVETTYFDPNRINREGAIGYVQLYPTNYLDCQKGLQQKYVGDAEIQALDIKAAADKLIALLVAKKKGNILSPLTSARMMAWYFCNKLVDENGHCATSGPLCPAGKMQCP